MKKRHHRQRTLPEKEIKRRRSQKRKILESLEEGPMTTIEGIYDLGIPNVPQRIHELRSDGYRIETEIINVNPKYKSSARIARYHLIKKKKNSS